MNGAAVLKPNGHDLDQKPGCPLSPYQLAVLQWVAHGKTDYQIAGIMGNTTEGAIQQHMHGIRNLLGAAARSNAVAIALRAGWIK